MFVRNWIRNRGGGGQLFIGGDSGTLLNPAQWLIDALGGGEKFKRSRLRFHTC